MFASDGNFYGATERTLFRMTPAGVPTDLVLSNGASFSPVGGVVEGRDGGFYGATLDGDGTIFRMTTDGTLAGTTRETLVNFTGRSGSFLGSTSGSFRNPYPSLIEAGNGVFYLGTYRF